jgi:choline dehydrogenase-like flavoprotein
MERSRKAWALGDTEGRRRCSAAKACVTPNLSRPNLKVMTDAHATRICWRANARWV